ncbi:hypothetical protein ALI144C_22675 [Actinosynnema sp. ALI-1.44]|nr:hypothetical protein ALI144C_22675 [Actinosynnema sp. ALI-1.44]
MSGSGRVAAALAVDEGLLHDGDGRVDAAFQPDQRLVGVVGPGVGEAVELLVLCLGGRDRVELLLGRIDPVAALAEPQPAVGIVFIRATARVMGSVTWSRCSRVISDLPGPNSPIEG